MLTFSDPHKRARLSEKVGVRGIRSDPESKNLAGFIHEKFWIISQAFTFGNRGGG